jgi:hypothetical protein
MRNISSAAKWVLFLLLGLPLLGHVAHGALASSYGSGLFGVIMCMPILGIGMLFYKFTQWHRAFHRRMRQPWN